MIPFFRKIRKQMADDDRPLQYARYAIGEIVLVVIGILIALQINNWNENRKAQVNTKLLLTKVHKELLYNINETNSAIGFYRGRDTLIAKVLKKQVTKNDYKIDPTLFYVITNISSFELSKQAFNELVKNNYNQSLKEDSIVNLLKEIYNDDIVGIDKMNKEVADLTLDFLNEKRLSKEWDYLMNNFTTREEILNNEEIMDYYLNDPFYLNNVDAFRTIAINNLTRSLVTTRSKLIDAYGQLSDYLAIDKDVLIYKTPKDFQHILGTYENDSGSKIKIIKENNQLVLAYKSANDSIFDDSLKIYPDDKEYFTIDNGEGFRFGKFVLNDNQNVSSLVTYLGSRVYEEYKKITKVQQ